MKRKLLIVLFTMFFIFAFDVKASSNLLETKTKDKVMFIKDKENKFLYSWSFDKKEYEQKGFEFDLGIEFTSPNQAEIDELIGEDINKKYLSFKYHGDLPSVATIKTSVEDLFKEGEKLNLYYYNDKKGVIELIKSDIKVINGKVNFEIEHCSDYFLTMSNIKNAEETTNSGGIIIVGMVIVIVGLIGYTLMKNK